MVRKGLPPGPPNSLPCSRNTNDSDGSGAQTAVPASAHVVRRPPFGNPPIQCTGKQVTARGKLAVFPAWIGHKYYLLLTMRLGTPIVCLGFPAFQRSARNTNSMLGGKRMEFFARGTPMTVPILSRTRGKEPVRGGEEAGSVQGRTHTPAPFKKILSEPATIRGPATEYGRRGRATG